MLTKKQLISLITFLVIGYTLLSVYVYNALTTPAY